MADEDTLRQIAEMQRILNLFAGKSRLLSLQDHLQFSEAYNQAQESIGKLRVLFSK